MAGKSHDGCPLTDPHKKISRPIFLSKKTSREILFFHSRLLHSSKHLAHTLNACHQGIYFFFSIIQAERSTYGTFNA